jgi:hypothetical protein
VCVCVCVCERERERERERAHTLSLSLSLSHTHTHTTQVGYNAVGLDIAPTAILAATEHNQAYHLSAHTAVLLLYYCFTTALHTDSRSVQILTPTNVQLLPLLSHYLLY